MLSNCHSDAISTVTDPTKKTPVKMRILLYLIPIGIIGAATIMLFGVAAVSLLRTGNEPPIGCCSGDRVLQNLGVTTAPIPAQIYQPTLDSAKILPALSPESASVPETPGVVETKPGVQVTSRERDATNTASEPRDAAPKAGAFATKMESTAVDGSEKAITGQWPVDNEVNATPDVSQETAPNETSDEGQDQRSRSIEIEQPQPVKLNQHNVASEERAPAQKVQNQGVHRQMLSSNAALQRRIQKECGPITFPVLRRHCVASFGVHR